jgi:two-component system response regulator YesN
MKGVATKDMYTAMIVDDERLLVKSLAQILDWDRLGVGRVLPAYGAREAKKNIDAGRVDVIICDIEMPGGSGMDVLKYAKERAPGAETILLTCHADFKYAQEALKLGGFDYFLKPPDFALLEKSVERAIGKIEEASRFAELNSQVRKYGEMLKNTLPAAVEMLWNSILSGRRAITAESVKEEFALYEIPAIWGGKITPVLIDAEPLAAAGTMEEERERLLEVKTEAAQILGDTLPCDVIFDGGFNIVALVYNVEGDEINEGLAASFERLKKYCDRHVGCAPAMIAGQTVAPDGICDSCRELLESRRGAGRGAPFFSAGRAAPKNARYENLARVENFIELLENGREKKIADFLDALRPQMGKATVESMENLYYAAISAVYTVFHKNGVSVHETIGACRWDEGRGCAGRPERFICWLGETLAVAQKCVPAERHAVSDVIERVIRYIKGHLEQNITREKAAAEVYMNPVYLARLFRKETGRSLADFILETKMEKAKELLADDGAKSGAKIGSIAEMLGYSQASHFAKLFKSYTGCTAQEYRKNRRAARPG